MLSLLALVLLLLQCSLFTSSESSESSKQEEPIVQQHQCVDGCVDDDNFLVSPKRIDDKIGFCYEIQSKYRRLVTAMMAYWVGDVFVGNSSSWQRFSAAVADPKTFYDVPLRREIQYFDEPRLLNFRIKNSTLLSGLRNEMAKSVSLVDRVKRIEFGEDDFAPAPSKLDIPFNYYHFFSPSLVAYYDSIKGEFPEHLRHPKGVSLEGFNVQVGRVPAGIHNQGNQNIGYRFNRIGEDFSNTFNIHFALTDVDEETAPLVFWQGARPEFISSRYVYKLLQENPELLAEKHVKSPFWAHTKLVESNLEFWKYALYKAEADWDDSKEGKLAYTRAGYLLALRYYHSVYCNDPQGKDLIRGIWFPVKAGQGVIFNPYQLHASDTAFPAASKVRHSLVLRACDKPECKVANRKYQATDEKLYECFALLFGYDNTDEFKETIFGTTNNKVFGLSTIQMDGHGVTFDRLKKHYARAHKYLSQDVYHIEKNTEKCFREYLAIGTATNAQYDL